QLLARLRRIKELDVSRSGTIRLVGNGVATGLPDGAALALEAAHPVVEADNVEAEAPREAAAATEPTEAAAPESPQEGAPRRRRRRGGRRRRGRRNNNAPAHV